MIDYTNPNGVDLSAPFLYVIRINAPDGREFRYVGKGSSKSRLNAYRRNIERIFAGETKRPLPPEGKPIRPGNLRYRHVHLVLAVAIREGWNLEHLVLENVSRVDLNAAERARIHELDANLNDGPSWAIEDFEKLAARLKER